MSTLNLQVGASNQDAAENIAGSCTILGTIIPLGNWSGYSYYAGFYFGSVSGLSGATIDSATLTFRASYSDSGSFAGDWYAEDGAIPGVFTDSNNDINTRARTTATCGGDGVHFGSWTTGQDHPFTGDGVNTISDIIQELADSHDPSAIVLIWVYASGTGERLVKTWNSATATAPKLDIDYTAVSGDINIEPSAVAMPLAVPTVTLDMGTKTITPDAVAMPLVVPTMTIKPADKTFTPDPVTMPLIVPAVTVTIATMITPSAVAMPLVVPTVTLQFGTKTLTPNPVAMPLVVPVVTVTGIAGAIVFEPYKPFGNEWRRTLNPAWWPAGTVFHLIILLRTKDAGTPARALLFNLTDGIEVSGSQLSTTETALTEVIGPSFSLPSGNKLYRVEAGGLQGGEFLCEDAQVRPVS